MNSINLTTIDSRLDLCSATIWSLMQQSLVPDQINIWISKDGYLSDKGISEIPDWVCQLNSIHNIIKIHYVNNTGPYRKIIPAIRESRDDDVLVYADDDVIYAKEWFEKIINVFERNNRKKIVATRIREKKKNIFGVYKSYNMLPICLSEKTFRKDFIITGIGGCVLSKKLVNPELLALDNYVDVAPKTDDIWLSKLFELSSAEVVCCVNALADIQEIQHSNNALNRTNTVFFKGGLLRRIMYSLFIKMAGYFGFVVSKNDKSIRDVDKFFDKVPYYLK